MKPQNNAQPDNGAHSFTEAPNPWSFCETPEEKCTMNYCDENGCQNRKRELIEAEPDPITDKHKLVSMTDFVIQQRSELLFKELGRACCKYADFLKRPLKLEMFVPCDDEGNALDKPENFDFHQPNEIDIKHRESYQKAKEKVLFELNSSLAVETMKYHISRDRNIEYLANFGSLDLTTEALKQFQ